MKQCFTHRLPSHLTLLSDPWPDDFAELRIKIESKMTAALPLVLAKSARRKPATEPDSGPVR
jgi:hypothetical protein